MIKTKSLSYAPPRGEIMALDSIANDRIAGQPSPAANTKKQQYGIARILGIWAVATLPMIFMAWIIMPRIIPFIQLSPVILYWIIVLLGMSWLFVLSLWIIKNEQGYINWSAIQSRIWLNFPRLPLTGEPRLRLFWRLIPHIFLLSVILALAALILSLGPVLIAVFRIWPLLPYSRIPAYAMATELTNPVFSGQWWLVALALFSWLLMALLGEELLFRGILLPKMSALFGKWDWFINACFSALYYLYLPWLVPFQFIASLVIARSTRRFRSFWVAAILRSVQGAGLLVIVLLGVTAAPLDPIAAEMTFPYIQREPAPSQFAGSGSTSTAPRFDKNSADPYKAAVDLRGLNLTKLDLRNAAEDLFFCDFDSRTAWPAEDHMPASFSPEQIMELGKNPGLGVRRLHEQGVTGRGIGIAIIDQTLLINHREYAGQLRWYEEIGVSAGQPSSMHGPAVASIAVGRSVGVAPEADLYYIAGGEAPFQLHNFTQGIRRIIQINEKLSPDKKIRVISISSGWNPNTPGYHEMVTAVNEARTQGIFVVSSNIEQDYGFRFHGLGRSPLDDPDDFEAYEPGMFWAKDFYRSAEMLGDFYSDRLLVPMDSRTTAGPGGNDKYVFYRSGGWSWSIPYIAGLYALAAQLEPAITPDRFWSLALETGRTVGIEYEGQKYSLGPVIDPNALIEQLQK